MRCCVWSVCSIFREAAVLGPLTLKEIYYRVLVGGLGYRLSELVTARSPIQYLKQLRPHEAPRLMLTEGLDASAASFRVGYESPSQFSREYRRLFGASPRREVASLLAPCVVADRATL
jgi:YesN/AraC family two-component response regulator